VATGHGGNLRALAARAGRDPAALLDFSASLNPLGPPECLRAVLDRAVAGLVHYPDPESTELAGALAVRHRVGSGQIVVASGSSEILFALARALRYDRAVIPMPSYIDYGAAAERAGRAVAPLALDQRKGFVLDFTALEDQLHGGELVMLGQPNNPTGLAFDGGKLRALAARHPTTLFVVDEAFADFLDGYVSLADDRPDNVVVVRSFTKFYAIPGLRLGYAVAAEPLAGEIRGQLTPWSVGTLAQAAGVALLAEEDYARQTVAYVGHQRRQLIERLQGLPGLHVYPGEANFLLVRLDGGRGQSHFCGLQPQKSGQSPALADALLAAGIAVRTFDPSLGLDGRFFRVAVRTTAENQRLCDALAAALGAPRVVGWVEGHHAKRGPEPHQDPDGGARCARPTLPDGTRKTPALMLQGTSSNAGKSILTAALCRILFQDGVRVAPFKAQNMSLNSFVTREGGEMGRAQVVQAQACRLEPDVRMNPILLKPNSETGSQVLLRGKPVGNMRVEEYVRFKPQAAAAACDCYDSLAAEFDAVVLEGAGSPGEVNLKSHDIVNMPMARHAGAAVLVVGDIDRGGVFASFVGTLEVLDDWERRLLRGWIVNRFRGDAALLQPALEYTLCRTGRPVLGVVPYIAALGLPQEDSVEFKSGLLDAECAGGKGASGSNGDAVEIAVIDLPQISNFTDLDAFRGESDVRLRIVRAPGELGRPDAVLIPGSKNTLADLDYLRRSGLADRIGQLARQGQSEVVGICGGFQMLGREIRDPLGLESATGAAPGLGLLEAVTVLAAEKTLARTTAVHTPSALEVAGYEIHHGRTDTDGSPVLFRRPDGQAVGAASDDGRVWGTYLHGVFDADAFRRWFIDRLRVGRGLAPLSRVVAPYDIEPALDRLAGIVRQSLDMEAIYRLMGL
jgi:cobyric acid synthase CobQ/L-threonine-O-3-phosphate decarboxylase